MASLYRRGRVWWLKWYSRQDQRHHAKALRYPDGQPVRSWRDARFFKSQLEQQLFQGHRDAGARTFAEAAAGYLQATQLRKGPQTHYIDSRHVGVLNHHLGRWPIRELTPARIEACLNQLERERQLSPKTRNHYLKLLRAISRWGVERGLAFSDFTKGIPLARLPERRRPWLTDEQWQRLLSIARQGPHYAMIATALYTGLRRGELVALEWPDVDWSARVIRVRAETAKSQRHRIVPIPTPLLAILWPVRKPKGLCFPNPRGHRWEAGTHVRILRPYFQQLGLEGKRLGWHLLRHSYATRYVQKGGSIWKLSHYLGHRAVTTTQIYSHPGEGYDPDIEQAF